MQSSIDVGGIIGSVYVLKGRSTGFESLMVHFYSNWNFVDQNFICVERQTDRQTDKQTNIVNRVVKTNLRQTLMVLPPANIKASQYTVYPLYNTQNAHLHLVLILHWLL